MERIILLGSTLPFADPQLPSVLQFEVCYATFVAKKATYKTYLASSTKLVQQFETPPVLIYIHNSGDKFTRKIQIHIQKVMNKKTRAWKNGLLFNID